MDTTAVVSAVAGLVAYGARVAYVWLRARTAIQLVHLSEQGLSSRVRALPPGSRLRERRSGSEVVIEVGTSSRGRGGARG